MKEMFRARRIRKYSIILFIVLFVLTCSVSAITVYGVYLGSGITNLANGLINYEIRAHVFYFENTSSELELSSLVQWVYNYGIDVDKVEFLAHDNNFIKYTYQYGSLVNPIESGNYGRIEADWVSICSAEGYDTTYQKNGDDEFAFIRIAAGFEYAMSSWNSYWFPANRYDYYA